MSNLDWLPSSITAKSTARDLAAGAALFHQGDKAVAIFLVEEGQLRLVRHAAGERPTVLHRARSGQLLAEAALFSENYHCDAVAMVASRVRAYPKAELLAAFARDADLAARFMELLAHEIHAVRARLEIRNIRSARDRIMHYLALGAGPDRTCRIDGTLMDLAVDLGLAHEALYRALADLEREGKISRSGREIILL
jgi:CRP-like cAMP-binding protein